jgi:biopolymer transport protein ExbB
MDDLQGKLEAAGIFVYPLLILAVVAVACAVDRFYVFYRLVGWPQALTPFVKAPTLDRSGFAAQLTRSRASNGYVRFLNAIMANWERPIWWIEAQAAEQAALVEQRLDRGLWILETAITAAPLLGLLGTITGMVSAFRLFGNSGAVDPAAVTGGVAEALIATAIGIVIALLALAAFNYLSHRRAQALDTMERIGTRLIDQIRLAREGVS